MLNRLIAMGKCFVLVFVFLLSAFCVEAQDSFTTVNGVPGGTSYEIQFDQTTNKAYSIDTWNREGFVSSDNGGTWKKFGPTNFSFHSFLIVNGKFYCTDNTAFYESTDAGATWVKKSSDIFSENSRLKKLPIAGDVFVLSDCNGVFISSDAGISWKKISTSSVCSYSNYSLDYTSTGDLYFSSLQGVFKHPLPGDGVWDASKVVQVFANQISGDDYTLSVGVSSTNKIYITYRNSTNTTTLIASSSTGNSGTFTTAVAPPAAADLGNYNYWSLSPAGKFNLVASGVLHELTNEAVPTWTSRTKPNQEYSDYNVRVVRWKSATEVYAGTDGSGIFRSTDSGQTWTMVNGTQPDMIQNFWGADIEVLSNGNIVAKGDNGTKGMWVSTDNGQTFSHKPHPFYMYGPRWGQKLTKLQDNSVIGTTTSGTAKTTDGINWSILTATNYDVYLPVAATSDVYGISGAGSALSNNLGVTWNAKTVSGMPASYVVMYGFYLNNKIYVAITNNANDKSEYWKIDVSGTPWLASKLISPLSEASSSSVGFFTLNNKIYGSDGTKIAISADEGTTWTTISNYHDQLIPIRQGVGGIGVSTFQSLLVTQDDGKNWRGFSFASQGAIRDIAQDASNNFYAVCTGGPLKKFTGNLILPANEIPPSINFSWQPLSGPNGGYYKKLFKNGSGQLFTASLWNIYQYNVGTSQWDRKVNPGIKYGLTDAWLDNNGKFYSITSNQLFSSTNNGSTWTQLQVDGEFIDLRKIIKAANGNLIITKNGGVLLSTNDGASFTVPPTANSGTFEQINISSTGIIFASRIVNNTSSLMKSADHGVTWSTVSGVDLSNNKEILSINALEAGALAVVTSDNIFKTTNSGSSWTSIKGNLPAIEAWGYKFYRKIFLSPANNQYYFSNYTALYSSPDGGTTWTKRNDTDYLNEGLDFMWQSSSLYKTTPYGIKVSTDNGNTFSDFQGNKGLFREGLYSLAATNGRLFAAGGGGQFLKSTDNGQTFSQVNSGVYTDLVKKLPSGKLIAFGSGFALSSDGGSTWVNQNAESGYYSVLSTPDEINYYAVRDLNGVRKIVKSTNLSTWTDVIDLSIVPTVGLQTIAAKDDIVYFLGYDETKSPAHGLYKVQFGAIEKIEFPTEPESVHVYNNKLYVFSWGRVLYESSDGITWTSRATPSGGRMTVTNSGYFFIRDTNISELWLSRDQGKNWQSIEFSGFETYKYDIDESSGYAYALVPDRPILKSSAIILPNDNAVPTVASLNPINADVNIPINFKITLTFSEAVKGIAGKKVRLFESTNTVNPVEVFDAPTGSLTNNGKTITFAPTVTINYLKSYFIIVDNGAFTDIFGNVFAGITNQTSWTFTTVDEPDIEKPVLTFSTSNLVTGTPKVFELIVSDNKSISSTNTKIFYRGISALSSAPFESASMTPSSGATSTNSKFTIAVPDNWYDAMGLEYYFEAQDVTGNKERSPSTENTYHYSYIKFEASKPKMKSLLFGQSESSYQIISVPHAVIDNQIATLFDELGEANDANWRMFAYKGDDQYDEYPATLKTISRGQGYWMIMRGFTDIFIENATTPENNRTDFFTLILQAGWNLIGNPYTVPISWEATRKSGVGPVKGFKNGSYANGDVLNPYEGGFVYSTALTDVKVRFQGITSGGRYAAVGSDLSQTSWELPIHIHQGELGNQVAGIGMNEKASLDIDDYDDYNPPPLSNRVEINFKTPKAIVAKNVVPTQENYSWKFEAVAEGNDPVKISWDNQSFGNNSRELYLVDEEEQIVINMRSQQEYRFEARGSRAFTIHFGENIRDQVKPSITLLGNPFPNPSSQKVKIPFNIAETAVKSRVRVEIYNAQGMLVAQLLDGEYSAGYYSVDWNLSETDLQSGMYFCSMISVDKNGITSHQSKKIIIFR